MNGLQKQQEEVKEATEIMMENYTKVNERGEKLSDMEERAEGLLESGKVFEKTTKVLMEQKKEEYESTTKKKCVFGSIGFAVAIIIGLVVFVVLFGM